MCNCSNFADENRPSEILLEGETSSFDGGGSWTDFVDDVEGAEKFDNFLTKKMRERRAVRKEAVAGGMTKEEAKAYALEKVPRQKLKEIIAKLKKGEVVASLQTPSGEVKLSSDPSKALDEVSTALANSTSTSTTPTANADVQQAGFGGKNTKWILIGAVVLIGGYFAWKKFGK